MPGRESRVARSPYRVSWVNCERIRMVMCVTFRRYTVSMNGASTSIESVTTFSRAASTFGAECTTCQLAQVSCTFR